MARAGLRGLLALPILALGFGHTEVGMGRAYHRSVLARFQEVLHSFIYKNQARYLIRRNVPLVAPGRKRDGSDPGLGDTETGFLEFPLDPFGTLKPSVIGRRQFV